jgi:hypothetical protein
MRSALWRPQHDAFCKASPKRPLLSTVKNDSREKAGARRGLVRGCRIGNWFYHSAELLFYRLSFLNGYDWRDGSRKGTANNRQREE